MKVKNIILACILVVLVGGLGALIYFRNHLQVMKESQIQFQNLRYREAEKQKSKLMKEYVDKKIEKAGGNK